MFVYQMAKLIVLHVSFIFGRFSAMAKMEISTIFVSLFAPIDSVVCSNAPTFHWLGDATHILPFVENNLNGQFWWPSGHLRHTFVHSFTCLCTRCQCAIMREYDALKLLTLTYWYTYVLFIYGLFSCESSFREQYLFIDMFFFHDERRNETYQQNRPLDAPHFFHCCLYGCSVESTSIQTYRKKLFSMFIFPVGLESDTMGYWEALIQKINKKTNI